MAHRPASRTIILAVGLFFGCLDAWSVSVGWSSGRPCACSRGARIVHRGGRLPVDQEDLRMRAAKEIATETVIEKMVGTRYPHRDRQLWVQELLSLMEKMLQADWQQRINAYAAACKLQVLIESLDVVGPTEIEVMLSDAIRQTDAHVGSCNKVF